jgi:surface protein
MKQALLFLIFGLSAYFANAQQPFITTWKTDNPGISEDNQITIPTYPGETYDYTVDWGDGTSDIGVTGDIMHNYTVPGLYEVAISGLFPRIYFNYDGNPENVGDKDKIIAVEQWGDLNWTSMEQAFNGCMNMDVVATDAPNLSNVTSMSGIFAGCTSLVGNSSFSSWNTTNIITMSQAFYGANLFNQDIGNWDVSNVINLYGMFLGAKSFNQPLGDWNTSNVQDMRYMFSGAKVFNQDLNLWDVSGIQTFIAMFALTDAFNGDISSWNVQGANDMVSMFAGALAFNQPLDQWDVSNVTNFSNMFASAESFNQNISSWNVSAATAMKGMFSGAGIFNQDLSNWDVINVTDMSFMFADAQSFDQDLGSWAISSVVNMEFMFSDTGISKENYDSLLLGWSSLPIIQNGVEFNAGNSRYCNGTEGRQYLIGTYGWNIMDHGRDCGERRFITTWKTDNPGSSNDNQITIPTSSSEAYDYRVDWGDGTGDSGITGNITHTYATPGTYEVRISGDFPQISFMFTGDKEKLLSVEQWGDIKWKSMEFAFGGCFNLDVLAKDTPNLSNTTNLEYMFAGCFSLVGNTSFLSWNVSNVEDTSGMFEAAFLFNQPIGNWDVSNVTDMRSMFHLAETFNQDIGNWNVGNVSQMDMMFNDAISFNQDLGSWQVANVGGMTDMFLGVTLSTENYDNLLNGWAGLPSLQSNVSFHAGNSQYCDGTEARQNLMSSYGWNITDGGEYCPPPAPFITTWKTDNPGTSDDNQITIPTTPGVTYNYTVDWGDGTTDSNVSGDITHTYVTPGTYTISISGDFPRIYFNYNGDKEKILSVDQWGTGKWSSMEWAFTGCTNLEVQATDIPDFSELTSLTTMFVDCRTLVGNGSMNNWDTSTVTTVSNMFRGASNFNAPIGNWNTSNITNMIALFDNATSFNQEIGNWDVRKVTHMRAMFHNAESFKRNIGSWNVSNVTDMTQMFTGASSFNTDIGNWDVSNVTKMDAMFSGAAAFNQDIGDWDVSKVTTMNVMFAGTPVNQDIGNWDITSVTDMGGMFLNATSFDQDISGWDVSNVVFMNSMFSGSTSFDQDLGAWDVRRVENMNAMFMDVSLSTENYDKLLIGWSQLPLLQNAVYFVGGNSTYCIGKSERQQIIDSFGWIIIDEGENPYCNQDNDNDGVADHLDACLDTPAGATVSADGCLLLAADNFGIESIGESCPDANNAQILITSAVPYDLLATINGTGYDFTNSLSVEDLSPGAYTLCITVGGQAFEQCYALELAEADNISGKALTGNGKLDIRIEQGTAPYKVVVNGRPVFQTFSRAFAVDVQPGDYVEVNSGKACEGTFSKVVEGVLLNAVFPNPTAGIFELALPGPYMEIGIDVFSMHSQLMSTATYAVSGGKVQLDISKLPEGVYLIKPRLQNPVTFKIVKQ